VSRDTGDYESARTGHQSVAVMFRTDLCNAQTFENPLRGIDAKGLRAVAALIASARGVHWLSPGRP
jgi:hypothetical protein